MLAALRRVLASHRRLDPWHVVDLCCGKGFLAALVAVFFPSFTVTAVDRRSGSYLPHFEAAGITNVQYARLDVMAPGFPGELRRLVEGDGEKRRPVAVLGMHLCGLLSIRAVDLLREVPGLEALVLAPCCLPSARHAEDTPSAIYQGADEREKFCRWCDFLETRMRSNEKAQGVEGRQLPVTCTREVVEAIISEKRTLLSAWRERL